MPAAVPEANPPRPSASSHSRVRASLIATGYPVYAACARPREQLDVDRPDRHPSADAQPKTSARIPAKLVVARVRARRPPSSGRADRSGPSSRFRSPDTAPSSRRWSSITSLPPFDAAPTAPFPGVSPERMKDCREPNLRRLGSTRKPASMGVGLSSEFQSFRTDPKCQTFRADPTRRAGLVAVGVRRRGGPREKPRTGDGSGHEAGRKNRREPTRRAFSAAAGVAHAALASARRRGRSGATSGGRGRPSDGREILEKLDSRPLRRPQRRDPQARAEDVVQVLLLGAVVLARRRRRASRARRGRSAGSPPCRTRRSPCGRCRGRAGPSPASAVALARRKRQDLEGVAVGVLEVERLDARRRSDSSRAAAAARSRRAARGARAAARRPSPCRTR